MTKHIHAMSDNVLEDVKVWRQKALIHVRGIQDQKEQAAMAARYYQADQASMVKKWPQMKAYLPKNYRLGVKDKEHRDKLIDPKQHKPMKGKRIQKQDRYEPPFLPILEQYRKLYGPFVPGDENRPGRGPRHQRKTTQRVETRDELYKKTFPELFTDPPGEPVNLVPKFHSYQERKDKGMTTTEMLKRKERK